MTQPVLEQDVFHDTLLSLWNEQAKENNLYKLRQKAWDHYTSLGLPSRKNEVYRYVPIRKLFANTYSAGAFTTPKLKNAALPECKGAFLVFVNGFFAPQLSDTSALPIVVAPLSEAVNTYGAFLTNQWTQTLAKETDAFAALNGALHGEGLFIYVPPKTVVETPIHVLHVIDTHDQSTLVQPRIHLFAGKNSQLELIRTQENLSGDQYAVNGSLSVALEEGANVRYVHTVLEEPADIWHFEAVRATMKRDSIFKVIQATDGSATIRHDYKVYLNGENAEAFLNGVCMLAGKRQAHTNVLIEHVAPHCRSNQLYKSALNDSSRSSFEGKIYVHQEAQKTEAFQLNNNLLLSDTAQADSKPNLEIFADDVKASHGATVGQLDQEQLFYLKTRGFSDTEAKNLLIYGFCKEVIDMIDIPSLREQVTERAKQYLTKG